MGTARFRARPLHPDLEVCSFVFKYGRAGLHEKLAVEVDFAGSNFTQGGHNFLVIAYNERTCSVHQIVRSDGRQTGKSKSIGSIVETIFDGYACHEGLSELYTGAAVLPEKCGDGQ
jgi:hypothetical protein